MTKRQQPQWAEELKVFLEDFPRPKICLFYNSLGSVESVLGPELFASDLSEITMIAMTVLK